MDAQRGDGIRQQCIPCSSRFPAKERDTRVVTTRILFARKAVEPLLNPIQRGSLARRQKRHGPTPAPFSRLSRRCTAALTNALSISCTPANHQADDEGVLPDCVEREEVREALRRTAEYIRTRMRYESRIFVGECAVRTLVTASDEFGDRLYLDIAIEYADRLVVQQDRVGTGRPATATIGTSPTRRARSGSWSC
jgi:hypothetical protein